MHKYRILEENPLVLNWGVHIARCRVCVYSIKMSYFLNVGPKDNDLEVTWQFSTVKNYSRLFFYFYKGIFYWTVTETRSVHLYKDNKLLRRRFAPHADQPCSLGGTADVPGSLRYVLPMTQFRQLILNFSYFQGCSGCGKCDCSGVKGQKVSSSALST